MRLAVRREVRDRDRLRPLSALKTNLRLSEWVTGPALRRMKKTQPHPGALKETEDPRLGVSKRYHLVLKGLWEYGPILGVLGEPQTQAALHELPAYPACPPMVTTETVGVGPKKNCA